MPFYTYRQNNSGGGFVIDKKRGISVYVIIEADSTREADARAEQIGLYFDGYGDCPCCGNRWSEFYGKPVADAKLFCERDPGRSIVVHYKDGRVEWPACTVAK